MSQPLRSVLLLALLTLIGCASPPPLPPDAPPADFMFVYTQELPGNATPAGSPDDASPQKIHVAVDGTGRMDIEATYRVPHVTVEKSTHHLRSDQFQSLYAAIRSANLFMMQNEWEGDDQTIGRETYFVLGNTRSGSVTLVDRTVPGLRGLRSAIHTYLPSLTPTPDGKRAVVVMDIRTKTFHPAGDAHVSEIPRAYRQEYPHQWAALDAGGRPCSEAATSR